MPSLYMRTPQKDSLLWTRKWSLTRLQICQCLDLGLPSLWNCENPKSLSCPHWMVLSVPFGGGHSEDVTTKWVVGWKLLTPPLSSQCAAFSPFCSGSSYMDVMLRVRWYWDQQDGIHDWTQLRPLCKLLRLKKFRERERIWERLI